MGAPIIIRQEERVALCATVLSFQMQIARWVKLAVYAEEYINEVLKTRLKVLVQYPLGATINAEDQIEPTFRWTSRIDYRAHSQQCRINPWTLRLLVP